MTCRRFRFPLVTIRAAMLLAVVVMSVASGSGLVSAQNDTNFAVGDELVVNTDALNLRAGPTRSAEILAILDIGAAVTITSDVVVADTIDWYGVDTDAGPGYVAGLFLGDSVTVSLLQGFVIGDTLVVDTDGLNLRANATIDSDILGVLANGDSTSVVNGPVGADGETWFQVASESGIGWVVSDFLAFTATPPSDSSDSSDPNDSSDLVLTMGSLVKVDTDGLNLRAAPSMKSAVVEVLEPAELLAVLDGPKVADGYSWYQVLTDAGDTGWVAAEFVALG